MLPSFICLDSVDDAIEKRVLAGVATVRMCGAKSAAELDERTLRTALVVAVWHTIRVDAALLARMRSCVLIVRMGVGYDNIDIRAAGKLGIRVANIPDYGSEEIADAALAMILGLMRGTLGGAQLLAQGEVVRGPDAIAAALPYVRRVRGAVLGIVGLGRIGSAVALRAKACGFDVRFYDPYVADGYDKALGIRRAGSLAELLAECACVSLHCNPVTHGADPVATRAAPDRYIDAAALARLPRGAFLVNTARGELIDEPALAAALRSGHLAAAALDVHRTEPYHRGNAAHSGELASAPNLFCTPHNAWYAPESRAEMRRKGAEAARAAALGAEMRNVVNLAHLDAEAAARRSVPRRIASPRL